MLILLQPLFLVFMGIVPSLCLRLSYTFMMPACLGYLYTVLILQQLTIAVSDVLPIMMFLAFTLMGGFMPLKEYVDSRFSAWPVCPSCCASHVPNLLTGRVYRAYRV